MRITAEQEAAPILNDPRIEVHAHPAAGSKAGASHYECTLGEGVWMNQYTFEALIRAANAAGKRGVEAAGVGPGDRTDGTER